MKFYSPITTIIEHATITIILIENTLISRINSISMLERKTNYIQNFPSYAALPICGFLKQYT